MSPKIKVIFSHVPERFFLFPEHYCPVKVSEDKYHLGSILSIGRVNGFART
jgi:hypothetical protein